MSTIDYLKETAKFDEDVSVEVRPDGIRLTAFVDGDDPRGCAVIQRKVSWLEIEQSRVNPLTLQIESMRAEGRCVLEAAQ